MLNFLEAREEKGGRRIEGERRAAAYRRGGRRNRRKLAQASQSVGQKERKKGGKA